MSQPNLWESQFEDQFKYQIHAGDSNLKSSKDSYSLDLLGFVGEVPMLLNTESRPVIKVEVRRNSEPTFVSTELQLQQNSSQVSVNESKLHQKSVHEPKPQQMIKNCSAQINVGNPKLTDKSPGIATKESKPQQTVKNITASVLQGKRVIIRTNSMSGEKSLIFKQKTGGNVEIPAKLSTFLKSSKPNSLETTIKKEVIPLKLAEQVHPSNVAHVVFPQSDAGVSRHKPAILKRPPSRPIFKNAKDFCDAVNDEVKNAHVDIKIEERDIFSEEVAEETKILPFDHDYFNFPKRTSEESKFKGNEGPPPLVKPPPPLVKPPPPLPKDPPPLVKIAPKPCPKRDEIIEVEDDDDRLSKNTNVIVSRAVIPLQIISNKSLVNQEKRIQNSSMVIEDSVDKFQGQQTSLMEDTNEATKSQQNKGSEEKQTSLGNLENHKTNDSHIKKATPSTNYEIVNANLIRKGSKDLMESKSTYIVMIANKEMLEHTKNKETTTTTKSLRPIKEKVTPPSFKIPFRQRLVEHKKVQTIESRIMKNVETNTDDFLLDELIEKKVREKALQNKVSKTTNTEEPPPPRQNFDERNTITPSPFLLDCNPSDILELLDGSNTAGDTPIIGENASFGTGPTMGLINANFAGKSMNNGMNGKVIENCVNANSVIDISYSRGKNICNGGWSAPETSLNMTNAWPTNAVGQNGRPRVEPWKLQLFLDLKQCDQFDSSGNMPLHNAVIRNNLYLVKRQCLALRTRQVDINTLNHSSYTALQLALLHDASVHIIQLLLQYGADTSIIDPYGNNVLHICVSNSSESVTKTLLASTACVDINGINFEGYTPLILCALDKKYVQADDLLSFGADPNIADKKSGRTPLFHAVEANDVEMVKLLLNHRAQTKVRNFFGTSPHDAMFELDTIDPQIRKLILNKDEIPNAKPKLPDVKGRRKRKMSEDRTYSVKPFASKNSRTKSPRS